MYIKANLAVVIFDYSEKFYSLFDSHNVVWMNIFTFLCESDHSYHINNRVFKFFLEHFTDDIV